MKSFSKRNPIPIGLASLAVIAVLLLVAYRADSLPVIGKGPEYHAQFSEAAGLAVGDEVRIAGVKIGKVTKVALDKGHVPGQGRRHRRHQHRVDPDQDAARRQVPGPRPVG
jgi:phospholipid/cholesterol/gamma-HCH transport system substrate-binding protein